MDTNRGIFIETFAKASPILKTIFLNHSGAPSRLLSDLACIEMYADKKGIHDFIEFSRSNGLVGKISVIEHFRRTEIWIEFKDRSELRFMFIRSIIRKALVCIHPLELRKRAVVNEFGMLVPSSEHHFDYLILTCQFAEIEVPERYKKIFSGFDFETRTRIFRYMQPKYDLVINTLDELYKPKGSTIIGMMVNLRKDPYNKLWRMIMRAIEFALFKIIRLFMKKTRVIFPTYAGTTKHDYPTRAAGQAVL